MVTNRTFALASSMRTMSITVPTNSTFSFVKHRSRGFSLVMIGLTQSGSTMCSGSRFVPAPVFKTDATGYIQAGLSPIVMAAL